MNLIATSTSSWRWRATHTAPMPPRASSLSNLYLSAMTARSSSETMEKLHECAPHALEFSVRSLPHDPALHHTVGDDLGLRLVSSGLSHVAVMPRTLARYPVTQYV